ncbi:hypothetical protein CTAYLR_003516 [Chrysophaeum taylorii]|uniref:Uncharacterized protein n=1 Tax=Chrysophaeum taylorii TaxID=2483200 RepID=A0AAD7UBX8_9STRA|nr:hypothetical protein CTAYLR_003516 [Chrysophaeum taylorii]
MILVVASGAMSFRIAPPWPARASRLLRAVPLTEENVETVLGSAREELSALFGYAAENREVGITGEVDLVGIDGPSVVVRLRGRFWHERAVVLARIANYLQAKIPEICDVAIEDPSQLDDDDRNSLDPPAALF